MTWAVHKFETNPKLVAKLAEDIAAKLRGAIDLRDHACMAVSGGSTPKPLFEALARIQLPWQKVTLTLVDERWVADTHPDSNAKLVKDYLLQAQAAKARFISLTNDSPTPFEAEAEIDERLANLPLPIDVVILGMGSDGHTASFFPGASSLAKALDHSSGLRCCGVEPPKAPHQRMTLTLPFLLQAENVYLHLVSSEKWRVLEAAMQHGPVEELPIRSFLHQPIKNLEIYFSEQ